MQLLGIEHKSDINFVQVRKLFGHLSLRSDSIIPADARHQRDKAKWQILSKSPWQKGPSNLTSRAENRTCRPSKTSQRISLRSDTPNYLTSDKNPCRINEKSLPQWQPYIEWFWYKWKPRIFSTSLNFGLIKILALICSINSLLYGASNKFNVSPFERWNYIKLTVYYDYKFRNPRGARKNVRQEEIIYRRKRAQI